MEMSALTMQNNFTRGILTLLRDNSGRSYTTKELAEFQHLHNGTSQITKSVDLLLKQGFVKVKSRGSELCYQVVSSQMK